MNFWCSQGEIYFELYIILIDFAELAKKKMLSQLSTEKKLNKFSFYYMQRNVLKDIKPNTEWKARQIIQRDDIYDVGKLVHAGILPKQRKGQYITLDI
jgi:hypothetical protein